MALPMLFAALAVGLAAIAWFAWQGGLGVAALGALVLAVWMGSMAANGLRRRR